MSLSTLRPLSLAAATLLSLAVLLVAIAPALVAAPAGAHAPAGLRAAYTRGIECTLSPAGRLA